ncbi:serine O-acetyltransferase [Methanosarcinales archaeon]|nr:serine O-acetyltransferase [Methanosarcinales archaeon]
MNVNILWKIRKKIFKYFAKNLPYYKLRIFLYKKSGYILGKQVYIGEGLTITEKLEDTNNLIIGDRVSIGPNVILVTSSDPNFSRIRPFVKIERGKIVINNDAWIGAGSIIMPNIEIGYGAIVGAGAVVTKNVESYNIVAGVPAKKIGMVKIK